MITQGRVTVDGQVVNELGSRVDPQRSRIALDGEPIHQERHVYFAVNKPKGYVSTNHDPAGKPKVVDILPELPQRVYTVGRLDEQSTGLMILTNDGELANRLAHPKFGVEKIYRVVVAGDPDRSILDKLVEGIWLAEGKVRAKRVRPVARRGEATVLEMTLAEGKNREIRRMLAKMGHKVMSLTRVSVGPVALKGLAVGDYRPLTPFEIDLLRRAAAGLLVPSPKFPDRKPRVPRAGGAPAQPESAGSRPRPFEGGSDRPGRRPPTGSPPAQGGRPRPEHDPRDDRPRGPRLQGDSRPPQNSGPRPPYNNGPRPPYNDGPRPHYSAGTRPPMNTGPRPQYNSGPRPPQNDGTRPPYNAGPRPPMNTGPRPQYNSGPRPPQNDGPRPPYNAGPRPPMNTGPRPQYNSGPRPPQNDGPRPPYNAGPRPPQNDGPRPQYNAGPRPPASSGARPPQRPTGPPQGIVRKPRPANQGPPPLPQVRSKSGGQEPEGDPQRIIIGLDQGPRSTPDRDGPPGMRRKRPVPKRSPRAAFGLSRKPSPGPSGESGDA